MKMADLVDVLVEDARWNDLELNAMAQQVCAAVLQHLGFDPIDYEISLIGCDDTRIAGLNSSFRDKEGATNVLSWPNSDLAPETAGDKPTAPEISENDYPHSLGDVAIAYETCHREAAAANKDLTLHVSHLLAHGTLHLLGYDHIRPEDADLMEEMERQTLATMGHPDPYGEC